MNYTYWRWHNGTLSRLHRTHPTYARYTWCGAICAEGTAGVTETFRLARQPRGVDLCEVCDSMSKPLKLNVRADKVEAA